MKITDFLNNEVVDFASYSTLRAIASYIDGLKNAHRKVVYYILDNNVNKEKKVFNLAGEIMTSTEYLHGDISGSVITLAQNYPGTNNMPLLSREGNFGTRFTNEASAVRYIYTAKDKDFDYLFNKADMNVLPEQYFEGTKIEPRFFMPTLPLILINGSEGIATGFAQKILPRDPKVIKDYILSYFETGKSLPILKPYFNGFTGEITQGETQNQWLIKGTINRINSSKIEITEIPVGYDLQGYLKVLDDLEDKKIIKSYKDESKDDRFYFEVSMNSSDLAKMTDEDLLQKLKLVKKVSENYTCIDENNRVIVFENASAIIEKYIEIKLKYLQIRKDFLTSKIEDDIRFDFSKFNFIKHIVEEKLIISKRKKSEIEADLENITTILKRDDSYDYLLNMNLLSLTEERMQKLEADIRANKEKLDALKIKEVKDIWKEEI